MIDHLLAFADEVAARADSVVGQYWTPGTRDSPPFWHSESSPGTLVWDPAADTTATIDGPAGSIPIVTHHPIDAKFRVTITLPQADPALINHPNLELAVDHGTGTVIRTTFTQPQLASLHMQPVFAGSTYPFLSGTGGLTK